MERTSLKILLAGDWHSNVHEEEAERALRHLGHETIRFAWHQYFTPPGSVARLLGALYKAQNKYLHGPLLARLNADLVAAIQKAAPDAVFVYRGSHVYAETIRRIKKILPSVVVIGYNNDDPFSPKYPAWYWRHFLAGVPEYDMVLAYRLHNLADFVGAGARNVQLLRSWYVPERNRPVALSAEERLQFGCDVVFAGHYEDDGRLKCLEEVVRRGWRLRLYGHDYGWHPVIRKSALLRSFAPVRTVWGDDYNKAICGARVALCFLSKLNRDTYTRRCFEIPASGTLMLAEYTDDLSSLFKPGEEADFFRSPSELAEKLDRYLGNETLRAQVAEAGRRRVVGDGHDVVSRMRQVVQWIAALREEKRGYA